MRAKKRLVLVSRRDLFRKCRTGGPGVVFPRTAVEPMIAVNPASIKTGGRTNFIGVYQQDRWSNGAARGVTAASSMDGGRHWRLTQLPFSACAKGGLKFNRASDPWVSIGPDGTAYAVGLSITIGKNGSPSATAISAVTSRNGGRMWKNLRKIKVDRNPQIINDKVSVTADSVKPGVAYAVWERITPSSAPTWFAKTVNGGKTWGNPRIIFHPGRNNATLGNQIVEDPRSGTLYNFFNWIITKNGKERFFVAMQKSLNKGKTWSRAKIIARFLSVGVKNPNTGAMIRTGGDEIPEPAVNPRNGMLYVVWQDARFSNGKYDEVAISSSSDGGKTWSKPRRVNTPSGKPAFTPMVQVNAAGIVGVSYYDFRHLKKQTKRLPTDYWIAFSRNGGQSFNREQHITGPFNLNRAPNTASPALQGQFLGDYQGLVAVRRSFRTFFSRTTPGKQKIKTDVFSKSVCP